MIYISRFISYLLPAVFILFSLLYISACSNREPISELIVKDGLIYSSESNELYTGIIKDKFLERIIEYEVLNGIKEGEFKVLFLNGNPEMSGIMKNNKNEGKWSYYYENGKVESEGIFKNDLAEDSWTWYYENGNIKETGIFRSGKRVGGWTMFDEQGKIIDQAYYIDGERKSDEQL